MFANDPLSKPGIHEKEIHAAFHGNVNFTGPEPVFDTPLYLLAFSNRSGSNLLANHLRSTRFFAGFHEQLIHSTVKKQATDGGCLSFPDYIKYASTNANPKGRRWGFKASYDQIMMLYRFGIDKMYPSVKIIHMTRSNVIDQAISYLIASQTQQWTSQHEAKPDVEPRYDYKLISHLVEECMMSELYVRTIASLFEADYFKADYQSLNRRPVGTIKGIGRFADLDLSTWKPKKLAIQKQSTPLNTAFYQQYIADRKAMLLGE